MYVKQCEAPYQDPRKVDSNMSSASPSPSKVATSRVLHSDSFSKSSSLLTFSWLCCFMMLSSFALRSFCLSPELQQKQNGTSKERKKHEENWNQTHQVAIDMNQLSSLNQAVFHTKQLFHFLPLIFPIAVLLVKFLSCIDQLLTQSAKKSARR